MFQIKVSYQLFQSTGKVLFGLHGIFRCSTSSDHWWGEEKTKKKHSGAILPVWYPILIEHP